MSEFSDRPATDGPRCNCPESASLQSFLDGRLSDEQCDTIAQHLEGCATCLAAISELERQSASQPGATQIVGPIGNHDEADGLKRAVARAIGASGVKPLANSRADSRFQVGMRVGSYLLLERLGSGGMGQVFLAEHEAMRRRVALKVLSGRLQNDQESTQRFVQEIRTSAKLDHPRFVKALDAGEFAGTPFLVMDFLDGVSLATLSRHWGCLPVADICELGSQIAEGLQVLTEHKLVHRDLKPSNVMLVRVESAVNAERTESAESQPSVKILDFGVARWRESSAMTQVTTLPSFVVGTLEYMAPEQVEASSRVDERADWYSLGVTLFKLLTGVAPLEWCGHSEASPLAKAMHLKHEAAPPIRLVRREVPRAVARIVDRLLSRDPARRPSPREVQRAFMPFAAEADLGRLVRELPEVPSSKPLPTAGRHWWWRRIGSSRVVLATAFVAAMLLFGAVVLATNFGDLSIEVLDNDAKVVITRGGRLIEVIDTREKRRVRLRPDRYELMIEGDDSQRLELSTDQVTIRRGTTEIAQIKLQRRQDQTRTSPSGPTATGNLVRPKSSRIVADWQFAQDANRQTARDGQMLLSFEGEARLWDDSGHKRSAHTLDHPRYRKYDASDLSRDNLDGWALQTGRATGALWCRGEESLAQRGYFSVWCRVKWDQANLGADQTLLARPGDWALTLQPNGHLTVTTTSDSALNQDVVKREHPPVPLTAWTGQWIDIGLTFDGDGLDDQTDVVTVFVDGQPRDVWRGVARFRNKSALHIGSQEANERVFEGLFDRVVVFDGVVTADELQVMSRPRLKEQRSEHGVFAVAIAPDESLVVTGGSHDDLELRSWPGLERKQLLKGHTGFVHSLAISGDGRWLASASEDASVRLWNLATGEVRHTLIGHQQPVFSVAFSPDNRWLVSAGADASIRVWNVETGGEEKVLRKHRGWVWSAVFSPDGKWMASGEGNAVIKLWELPTFREVTTLTGHNAWVRSLVFSPDSKRLYSGSGDSTIRVWDVEQQELKATIQAHAYVAQTLALSGDGRVLVSGGFDHLVKFWDADTLKELPIPTGGRHQSSVLCVQFGPKSPLLISGSNDGAIRIWPLKPH